MEKLKKDVKQFSQFWSIFSQFFFANLELKHTFSILIHLKISTPPPIWPQITRPHKRRTRHRIKKPQTQSTTRTQFCTNRFSASLSAALAHEHIGIRRRGGKRNTKTILPSYSSYLIKHENNTVRECPDSTRNLFRKITKLDKNISNSMHFEINLLKLKT